MNRALCILCIVLALLALGLTPRISQASARGLIERSTAIALGVWVVGIASTLTTYTLWKGR